jgi:hypothetical protein
MHVLRLSLLITIVALLALPAVAAASPSQIYDDCQDNGRLDKTYPTGDYRKALKNMPEDLDEYTDCRDLVRAGLAGLNSSGGNGSNAGGTSGAGGSGGGSSNPDIPQGNGAGSIPLGPDGKPLNPEIDARPDEKAELNAARTGETIRPTSAGVRPGEPNSDLPGPLIAVLILAGLAAAAAGGLGVKQILSGRDATA